jgi:hypothetical protein
LLCNHLREFASVTAEADAKKNLKYDWLDSLAGREIKTMSTWRLIAECRAFVRVNEAISVGGLNPWDHNWASLDEPPIVIPDPESPSQDQWLRVYEIGDGQYRVRFAAYLRDNKTWSFYVPASPNAPGMQSSGFSCDNGTSCPSAYL